MLGQAQAPDPPNDESRLPWRTVLTTWCATSRVCADNIYRRKNGKKRRQNDSGPSGGAS